MLRGANFKFSNPSSLLRKGKLAHGKHTGNWLQEHKHFEQRARDEPTKVVCNKLCKFNIHYQIVASIAWINAGFYIIYS